MLWCFRVKWTSGCGHGCRRRLLRSRCPPCRDDRRWLGQRSCVPRSPRSSSWTWTSWRRFCGVSRQGTRRRGLRDDQGGDRVLRLPGRLGGRQEHDDRSPAEDALRCEDGEDRGGARQQTDAASASTSPADAAPDASAATKRGDRRGNRCGRRCARRRRAGRRGTAATGPTPTPAPRRSRCRTSRCSRAIPARSAKKARSTRRSRPGVLVRLVGQAPVGAKVYYLQKLRCDLCGAVVHGRAAGGRGRGEVRRDGGQHDCPAEIRHRDAVPPRGEAAGEPGHSAAGLDAVGHRRGPGGACRAGLRRAGSASGPRRRAVQRRHDGQDPGADGRARPAGGVGGGTADAADDSAEVPAEDAAEGSAKKPGRSARACSPRASWRRATGTGSRCSSADASTPGRTSRTCCAGVRRSWPPPIQMCDALSRNLPGELKTIWPTAWPTAGGSSSMWRTVFPKSAGTCWRRWRWSTSNDAMARERNLSPQAAAALSPGRERPDHGGTPRLACAAVRPAAGGAQLGAGQGHRVPAEALGEADAVPARGRGAAGQQHLRAGVEEGDPAPQECPVLQDAAAVPTWATCS